MGIFRRRRSVPISAATRGRHKAAGRLGRRQVKKTILGRHGNNQGHWVGDGFPVRSLFSYNGLGQQVSPFLLLDYAGPHMFEPTTSRRGVGQHPHRGFETVTIVYDGEVEHRDSAGHGGVIGPGDVQWMTAGGGIIHEEYHSPRFRQGGRAVQDGAALGSTCPRRTSWPPAPIRASKRTRFGRGPARRCWHRADHRGRAGRHQGPGAHLHPDQCLGHAPSSPAPT